VPSNSTLHLDARDESERDARLIALVRSGDQAAFEEIFRQYHEGLWRFAYHQLGCAETSREIVQDVFFALWRKHAEWEVTSSISGWLYGAVRHHILRHRRTARAVTRITDRATRDVVAQQGGAAADDAIGVAMGAPARDAHDLVEEQELESAVTKVLAALPERRRLAMTLRWKHDLPAPEIARVLGTTPQAVRHLLMRAREEIAALLNARGV
jgi:RNA polymerase sigma-70 factor, ECF subfamily